MNLNALLFVLCLLPLTGRAQIGLTGGYLLVEAPEWEEGLAPAYDGAAFEFYTQGYKLGADYWFRLKNVRVEFLPGISYQHSESTIATNAAAGEESYKTNLWGLHFPVNLYPFDLYGDCDCPTWSKTEPFLQKGFFFQLSPGLAYVQNSFSGEQQVEDESLAFQLSIGAGLDIGLSDLLTLTPLLRFTRTFDVSWNDLLALPSEPAGIEPGGEATVNSPVDQLELGIRVGFRFDQQ